MTSAAATCCGLWMEMGWIGTLVGRTYDATLANLSAVTERQLVEVLS
jgi:hypothetical protein